MMTEIFCPHCGGQLQIDMNQRLQAMLNCPYCGRKSLMQKTDDNVQLRGIILPSAFGNAEADRGEGTAAPATSAPAATPVHAATMLQTAVTAAPMTASAAPMAAPAAPVAEPTVATTAPKPAAAPLHATACPSAAERTEGEPEPTLERLVRQAQTALAAGQMLAFNSYARQAIDCDPTDPRMYAVRARLIEEAHGFARATFLSPGWREQTPRQRNWIMAQHFATLNAAIACSPAAAHGQLTDQAGSLIARQIRETFLEKARLRLGRKPFRGRFRLADLRQAPVIVETCLAIDESIVPRMADRLLMAIRDELGRLDPALARHLKRVGL